MPDSRGEIARTIARLDHPDAFHQDEILATLTARGDEAREVALASLGMLNPRVHRALLRWLNTRVDASASLALMRYIFDSATRIEEQSGRTLAMAMLERLVEENADHDSALRGRSRAFAEDLLEDRDPDVVAGALRLLQHVGDGRSALRVESLREPLQNTNPAALQTTLNALSDLTLHGEQPQTSREFSQNLIASAGPRRRVLLREWRRRPDRGEVALAIIAGDEGPVDQALQILIASPFPQARASLQRHVQSRESGRFALALQALSGCASAPASPVELDAIRRALVHPEALVRQAGAALAGALAPDDSQVEGPLVGMLLESDPLIREAAARALAALPGSFQEATLARVLRAADLGVQRLQNLTLEPDLLALAWTLRALARRLSPSGEAPPELRAIALITLQLPGQHRPLQVASLELLDRLSLKAQDAWPEDQLAGLIALATEEDARAATRAADILIRVAPVGLDALDKVSKSALLDPLSHTIPLLARSGSEAAYTHLVSLEEHDDPEVRQAAHDALATLRQRRNDADFIEAHFIPRSHDD